MRIAKRRRNLAFCLVCLVGCTAPRSESTRRAPSTTTHLAPSERAALVGEAEVSRQEVARLALALGITPRDALERLEEEALLVAEAEKQGIGEEVPVRSSGERVAVQRLLAVEVEEKVQPSSIPLSDVTAYYEAHHAEYDHPELRHSVHVLAKLSNDAPAAQVEAARRFIERVIVEMTTENPTEVVQRYAALAPRSEFEVVAQEVPPLARTSEAAPAYLEAIFDLSRVGVFPQPVQTSFGIHAVALTRLDPEAHRSVSEVAPEIRSLLVTPLRERRVAELIRGLEQRTQIVRNEESIEQALAHDLSERAP